MTVFETTTILEAALDEVWDFFSSPRNLATITPRSLGFTIVSAPDRPLRRDDRIEYRIRVMGLPLRWVTRLTEWDERKAFTDVQERGPYRRWVHRHEFEQLPDGTVRMSDRVEYELPLGVPGRLVAGWWVDRQVREIFAFRAGTIRARFRERAAAGSGLG